MASFRDLTLTHTLRRVFPQCFEEYHLGCRQSNKVNFRAQIRILKIAYASIGSRNRDLRLDERVVTRRSICILRFDSQGILVGIVKIDRRSAITDIAVISG